MGSSNIKTKYLGKPRKVYFHLINFFVRFHLTLISRGAAPPPLGYSASKIARLIRVNVLNESVWKWFMVIKLHWSVVVGRSHHSGIKTTTKMLKPSTLEAKVCNYTGLTVKLYDFAKTYNMYSSAVQHSKCPSYNTDIYIWQRLTIWMLNILKYEVILNLSEYLIFCLDRKELTW